VLPCRAQVRFRYDHAPLPAAPSAQRGCRSLNSVSYLHFFPFKCAGRTSRGGFLRGSTRFRGSNRSLVLTLVAPNRALFRKCLNVNRLAKLGGGGGDDAYYGSADGTRLTAIAILRLHRTLHRLSKVGGVARARRSESVLPCFHWLRRIERLLIEGNSRRNPECPRPGHMKAPLRIGNLLTVKLDAVA